jgi:hypothetical protein
VAGGGRPPRKATATLQAVADTPQTGGQKQPKKQAK